MLVLNPKWVEPGMVPLTFKWISLLSSNLSGSVSIDTPRGVSMVIPDPMELAMKTDHQSYLLMFWTSGLQEWKKKNVCCAKIPGDSTLGDLYTCDFHPSRVQNILVTAGSSFALCVVISFGY